MPRSPSPARSPRSVSRSRSPRSRSRSPVGPDTIRVMKLTKNVTTLHLEEIFDVYGRILDIDLPIVQRLGTHKGTAWITFASPAAAAKAADYMDGGQIDGSIVTVVLDEPSPRGGGMKRASVSPYRERRGSGIRGGSASPTRGRTPSRSPVRARGGDPRGRGGLRSRSRSLSRSRRVVIPLTRHRYTLTCFACVALEVRCVVRCRRGDAHPATVRAVRLVEVDRGVFLEDAASLARHRQSARRGGLRLQGDDDAQT